MGYMDYDIAASLKSIAKSLEVIASNGKKKPVVPTINIYGTVSDDDAENIANAVRKALDAHRNSG